MSVYLGIDIGTSGTKTVAIRPNGKVFASATATYPCYNPKPLWSEQAPEDWWQATIKTVRAVLRSGKIPAKSVRGIGLSGQMHGSVFLDKKHRVLRRAILWNDQRTAKECAEIENAAGGREQLIRLVANPALTGFTAPKILWLRNNDLRMFEKVAAVLLPKDEIRRRLTGELATEASDASGTLLLDVAKRNWSLDLLAALRLDNSLFPRVYESEDVTGTLTAAAAKELGLTTDCIVVGGAADNAAGAVGTGIVSSGTVMSSLGTSGVMFIHSDEVRIDPRGRVHTFCHAVRDKWCMLGCALSSGGSLQWFRNALCAELVEVAKRKKVDVYDLLTKEAAATPVGADGLFFLPYLSGERTPHADPNARGCFVGLTMAHRRGHMVRAMMEGVTYSLRDALEIYKSLGIPVKQLRAIGGGAKSPLWRQMQADVFGVKVAQVNAVEGAALGVALLAAVGGGEYKNVVEACQATIKTTKESAPNVKAKKFYDQAMPIYQGLYHSLRDDFPQIAALSEG